MHLLYEVLLSSVQRIRVDDGSGSASRERDLPVGAIQAVGFGREEGMLEYDERSFLGYRLLTEYSAFPTSSCLSTSRGSTKQRHRFAAADSWSAARFGSGPTPSAMRAFSTSSARSI